MFNVATIFDPFSYSYLSCVHCTYSSGCIYLRSNMNITERVVELQKENVKSLQLQRETAEKVRTQVVRLMYTIHLCLHPYKVLSKYDIGFWSYMQINSIRPKTGEGDN